MSLKIGINLIKNYSINFDLPKRSKKLIKFIILHYTGMKNESDAIERLQNPKSKVSSHYLIKKNGEILNLIPDLYEAWHAGVSSWKNFRSLNKNSIGVEISNPGHQHGYRSFSSKQILSLQKQSLVFIETEIQKIIQLFQMVHDYIVINGDTIVPKDIVETYNYILNYRQYQLSISEIKTKLNQTIGTEFLFTVMFAL